VKVSIGFVLLVLLGAISSSGITAANPSDSGVPYPADSTSSNVRSLERIDTRGIGTMIKQHRGKVLVVNIWATWCVPCVEEFPDLVRLANDLQSHDVRVIGISIDDPEDSTSKVVPFLKRHSVPFENFLKAAGNDEEFINAFSKKWSGAVPATFLYDASGKQRTMMVGKQRYETLRKAVEGIIRKIEEPK